MIDQNNPGHWMGIGVIIMVLGIIAGALSGEPRFGYLFIGAGGLLLVVGLIMFAVRAGMNRPD